MKKRSLLFITFYLSYLLVSAQSTSTLKGQIKNATSDKVEVFKEDMKLDYKKTTLATTTLDKAGKFELKVSIEKMTDVIFKNGQEHTNITLYPDQKTNLILNFKDFDKSIKYSGDGALINNYNAATVLSNHEIPMSFFNLQEKEFLDSFRLLEAKSYERLETFAKQAKTTAEIAFFKEKKELLQYHFAHRKALYPDARTNIAKEIDFAPISADYFAYLNDIKIEQPTLLDDYSYTDFLNSYLKQKVHEVYQLDTNQNKDDLALQKIQELFSPPIQIYLIAKYTMNAIKYESNEDKRNKWITTFRETSENEAYATGIENAIDLLNKLKKGKEAPLIIAKDENGHKISTDQYHGKIIYVDVWASWCGPCKREIPFAKKLYEELQGDDIVFINVSVDADGNQWREALKKYEPQGVNVIDFENNKSKIREDYAISGIPRYIIIDKDGNIADSNAPRPSGDALPTLKALLGR